MNSRLNPYLNFDGNARDAMEFYRDVFGGDLSLTTFGEFGQQDEQIANKIMHGMLETETGLALMGADMPPGETTRPGNNFSVSLSGDNADELRGYWDKLSSGGTVTVPMERQMWGDEFGMCIDRFGVPWLVNIAQPQGSGGDTTQAQS